MEELGHQGHQGRFLGRRLQRVNDTHREPLQESGKVPDDGQPARLHQTLWPATHLPAHHDTGRHLWRRAAVLEPEKELSPAPPRCPLHPQRGGRDGLHTGRLRYMARQPAHAKEPGTSSRPDNTLRERHRTYCRSTAEPPLLHRQGHHEAPARRLGRESAPGRQPHILRHRCT